MLTLAISLAAVAASLGWSPLGRQGLPDFSQWRAGEVRKERFFAFLRPLLKAEDERVLEQRARLERIAGDARQGDGPGFFDRRWLRALAGAYDVDPGSLSTSELISELLLRVDTVPVSLGLAQAAKESAWGTSRFAEGGNALFGQRCFDEGCGMVPSARVRGARHEVKTFPSPRAAVASYVKNLNTHPDYQQLRALRAELRAAGKPVTGVALASTLAKYSERRDAYIQEIRQMIRFNGLGPAAAAP